MTVGSISTSNVNAIKGTNLEGMSIQMMAAMVMLEVGATKKKEAELKIADMKAQNDKAKALNAFLDKLNSKLGAFTKDEDTDKIGRGKVLNELADELQGKTKIEVIGDAKTVRNALYAVREGYLAGRNI